jgi:hypothetical protein
MKPFEFRRDSSHPVCPICGTDELKPSVLIPIVGEEFEDNPTTTVALQTHVDCILNQVVILRHQDIIAVSAPFVKRTKPT